MVTILEPRESVHVESAPPSTPREHVAPRQAMTYSMPFPGVRYYAFRPEPPQEFPLKVLDTIRQTLPVKLIDERVILL